MEFNCRFFNGYKPCGKSAICDANCASRDPLQTFVLIIHLGAMGAVVRSTALLPGVRRKYPGAQITWVTDSPTHKLLQGQKLIDKVISSDPSELLALQGRHFDVALVIDKSAKASGILAMTKADQIFGFKADPRFGGIRAATPAAEELWSLGLNDHQKFFVNEKTENQLVFEALELGDYQRDESHIDLSPEEQRQVVERAQTWRINSSQPVIGLNTGCGPLMPAKKWTVDFHRLVIQNLQKMGFQNIVLLGGPEDNQRNTDIAKDLNITESPTTLGIRDGAVSVAACDIVITGDSFAMHVAIAFQKFNIVWFGPSCAHEIDLYHRGVKLYAEVSCSPCWKRSCLKPTMCYDQVSWPQIQAAVLQGVAWWNQRCLPAGSDISSQHVSADTGCTDSLPR